MAKKLHENLVVELLNLLDSINDGDYEMAYEKLKKELKSQSSGSHFSAMDRVSLKLIIDTIQRLHTRVKELETAIVPIRIDSYAGKTSALEAYFFKDGEEYGGKSIPDKSMWIAVHMVNGEIDSGLTDYGYFSIEELAEAYKGQKILKVS